MNDIVKTFSIDFSKTNDMKKNCFAIIFLFGITFCACRKSNSTPAGPQTNVYVAGYESNGTHNVAKYWKNGVAVNLTNGSNDAFASSIVVSGNDVYVAGYEFNGTYNVAKYWKNGTPIILTTGSLNYLDNYATSIAISGNDVYVAGYGLDSSLQETVPKYWKNGKVFFLDDGGGGYAYSIAASGNDIYISGVDSNGNAAYWKNNTPVELADDESEGRSIAVSGNDVYVAGIIFYGQNGRTATVWKNGVASYLIDRTYETFANSIAVSGNDVYVGGYEFSNNGNAVYWKNDTIAHVGLLDLYILSITVNGADVYAAGDGYTGSKGYARYWKNGTPVNLSDGTQNAVANSIFITNQ